MTKTFYALPLFALVAACAEEAPQPEPTETVAPTPTPTLPSADMELFSGLFAEACPGNEPVGQAVCRRGLGAPTVSCEYALGDDEYMRHDAILEVDETGENWMIQDTETVCAQHD